MNQRRGILKALAIIGAFPDAAFAQVAQRLSRIGVLSPFIGPDSAFFEALRQRLQELGYVEGTNAAFIYRAAEDYDGLARHAAEMVRLQAHVIVTAGAAGVRAAMSASKSTPIVIANVGDAVAQGFVASLARPGGNVTGLTSLNTELSVKRLELLADALPSIRQVVALGEAVGDSGPVHATEAAARARGLKLEVMQVREADELAERVRGDAGRAQYRAVRDPGAALHQPAAPHRGTCRGARPAGDVSGFALRGSRAG